MWTHCRWINIYSQFPCTDILQKLQPQIGQISKLMAPPAGQRLVLGFLICMCFKLSLMFIRKNGCLFVCMLKAYLSVCLPELLVCLPACLTACLTVYLSAFLPACINACLAAWMLFISVSLSHLNLSILTLHQITPICQSAYLYLHDYRSTCQFVMWSVDLSVCPSAACQPARRSVGVFICLSIGYSVDLLVGLSISWSVCRSAACLPTCPSVSRCVSLLFNLSISSLQSCTL